MGRIAPPARIRGGAIRTTARSPWGDLHHPLGGVFRASLGWGFC